MRRSTATCCWVVLLAGCTGQPGQKAPAPPGRFPHSAIHTTSAPWDGAAVRLYLSEKPIPNKPPVAPFLSVQINRGLPELTRQRVRLEGKESRTGSAQWIPRAGAGEPVTSAEITFQECEEGKPVTGTYEVVLRDGKRERGSFEADWLPSDGPGG